MSTPRFFCETRLTDATEVRLPTAVAHHIRVRRLKVDERIVLFDGSGTEFEAKLGFEPDGTAYACILSAQSVNRELRGEITLMQGLASQEKMDWIIEKSVELGVTRFIPISATRSVTKLDASRTVKRLTHWQRLITASSEQCGRNRLMEIVPPCHISDALKTYKALPKVLCQPDESNEPLSKTELLEKIRQSNKVAFIIGPEGGWDPEEVRLCVNAGATPVSLGARVLRTETAGISAVCALSTLLNWS